MNTGDSFRVIKELEKMNSCFEKIYHQMQMIESNTKGLKDTLEKSFKDNADVFVGEQKYE